MFTINILRNIQSKMSQEAHEAAAVEQPTITMEELIASTVRAINLSDNRRTSNLEVSALLPSFTGNEDPEHWFARIERVRTTYNVDKNSLLMILITKLDGDAKQWYFSRPEYASYDYDMLRNEIMKIFECREDKITLMKKFESRKWRKNEKFSVYFREKVLLGNRVNLDESDMINYIIDGFDNNVLQSQARMTQFTSMNDLLSAMNSLTENDRGQSTNHSYRKYQSSSKGSKSTADSHETTSTNHGNKEKCFNCNKPGHLANNCPSPKRQRGSCYNCGRMGHFAKECRIGNRQATPDSTTMVVNKLTSQEGFRINIQFVTERVGFRQSTEVLALLDTGSPISFIKISCLPFSFFEKLDNMNEDYFGINQSKLEILGKCVQKFYVNDQLIEMELLVVSDATMSVPAILGRDFLKMSQFKIEISNGNIIFVKERNSQNCVEVENSHEIMQISIPTLEEPSLNINDNLPFNDKTLVNEIIKEEYLDVVRPPKPKLFYEMNIILQHEQPFSFRPRRLSYHENSELSKIIDELKEQGIIKDSNSPYCSPIVLVKKKNGTLRLCIDYRELNKITIPDHFPLPLIEDQIDKLKNKNYFTTLDLKNGFHHVNVAPLSVKYTSFITPLGQYEYLKMPFGLRNGPSAFQRYINTIFGDLISQGKILLYLDDLLIATQTFVEHCEILRSVLKLMVDNLLELRLDKCKFLHNEIIYLGYLINQQGILPNPENVEAVAKYPIPKNVHEVHRFLGLVSYFRKFIQSFSTIAKPLYDLIRKGNDFHFSSEQIDAFELLKDKLLNAPVLTIYSPSLRTELHCDACSKGYGAILLQKQDDGKFRPVFYFSKRTTDVESKYHSYELEMLAIINALNRFRIYLQGIPFTVVTDCNSIKLALSKKDINPRINRWALILQNYEYTIEHRSNNRMKHVDALSRCNVFILEENTFEQNIVIAQNLDPEIQRVKKQLEIRECKDFELHNGILYKKSSKKLLFYVPFAMENQVIRASHDEMGHIALNKTIEYMSRVYWFPDYNKKVKNYIQNCLKCISYAPSSGKPEGVLHNIPKGNKPFMTIHIDHYGPLEKSTRNYKYIFEIADGFTKFVRFYEVKGTKTCEVINKLKDYFRNYSKPLRIVSDRGTCFTSHEFDNFMCENDITHIKVATACPKANGQIERFNRDLTPMLSKLVDFKNKWPNYLPMIEYAINNSYCRSICTNPTKLLFGITQRDPYDSLRVYLENLNEDDFDLKELRDQAEQSNLKIQAYNKNYYDSKHKEPYKYSVGDFVMIRNFDSTPGVNKKLIPKYKGPYEVEKVLGNDRYLLKDVDNFQLTNIPYSGVSSSDNMKLWLHVNE